MADHMQAAVEAGAKALDGTYNPDRYPIMAAMFSDYAARALDAALPHLRAMIADEIMELANKSELIKPDKHGSYYQGHRAGLVTAAVLARGETHG